MECLQCSPKDSMISKRVRHLFIFLAYLYPLLPALLLGLFHKQRCCWGCSPSRGGCWRLGFFSNSNIPSMDVLLVVDSVVGGLISRYFTAFPGEAVCRVVAVSLSECLFSSAEQDLFSYSVVDWVDIPVFQPSFPQHSLQNVCCGSFACWILLQSPVWSDDGSSIQRMDWFPDCLWSPVEWLILQNLLVVISLLCIFFPK